MTKRDILDLLAAIVVGLALGSIMGVLILEAGWGAIGILGIILAVIWAGDRFMRRLL
jgi:hypothetical protein